jgi:hypothetical protein
MLLTEILKVAIESIRVNKLRSFLTMLGIIIGIAAVITMVALGEGAQRSVQERIEGLGTNVLTVRPGQQFFGGVDRGSARLTAATPPPSWPRRVHPGGVAGDGAAAAGGLRTQQRQPVRRGRVARLLPHPEPGPLRRQDLHAGRGAGASQAGGGGLQRSGSPGHQTAAAAGPDDPHPEHPVRGDRGAGGEGLRRVGQPG